MRLYTNTCTHNCAKISPVIPFTRISHYPQNRITDGHLLSSIVEGDGSSHAKHRAYDARRDAYFLSGHVKTLRFPNQEFYKNINSVLNAIKIEITLACDGNAQSAT